MPESLAGLTLYSNHFEQQYRNLYDVCSAPDVLNVRTASMRYDGWDTHNNQISRICNNLEELFGSSGGLHGEMFPEREANPDGNGKLPLETSGADVLGQTSTRK